MFQTLFSEITIKGLTLKNRVIMAPLFLGYADEGGTVSDMLLTHYQQMAESGVAMIVVEGATVDHPEGSLSNRNLRADTQDNVEGLKKLAATIKKEGVIACLQLNHAGCSAYTTQTPVAPSETEIFGRTSRELDKDEISDIINKFAKAAAIAKSAGFDMVEINGGSGHLPAQFLSPKANKRTDEYGGSLENRRRFSFEILKKINAVAENMPVGYRFTPDASMPHGLHIEESRQLAGALEKAGIAYISVMGRTYEPFPLPKSMADSAKAVSALDMAAMIRADISIPVITSGRFAIGAFADNAISEGKTDLIGLARVLWADPSWLKKVQENRENEIVHCKSHCGACMEMVRKGQPAYCMAWPFEKRKKWKAKYRPDS